MSDDIRGENTFIIRPDDANVPMGFTFEPCSAIDVNDGSIPFNTNVASVVITAYNSSDTDVSSTMIGIPAPSVLDNRVAMRLNWPGAAGRYYITIVLTLDDGSKKGFLFDRFKAESY